MSIKLNPRIEIVDNGSYKIGVDEVKGLKESMERALKPVQAHLQKSVYWSTVEFEAAEYKSRDGFIANRDNGGGVIIDLVLPSVESCSFPFLEFGECDGCNHDCTVCTADEESSGGECSSEIEGHLDARLRIWFKFEGLSADGKRLKFYINACGGNGDAPYFRVGNLADVFEVEFSCTSVASVPRAAAKHVKALLKALGSKQ